MTLDTLTIVGVGLIGGSIGLGVKRRALARRVLGVGRQQSSLDQACERGAIDDGFLELAPAVREADLVVFCTPVDQIAPQVLESAGLVKPGTILTDAGSTKGAIVQAVEADPLPAQVKFVGGHPLAGSEKRGPEFANLHLFEGRLTVLTRTAKTDDAALEVVASLWRALGARVKIMTPEEHDQALALTSHLPHLLAAALAGVLPRELQELTASGFRDTTRIAAGDPALWTGIFSQNQSALLDALQLVQNRLHRWAAALKADDRTAVTDLLSQAKKVRDALGS